MEETLSKKLALLNKYIKEFGGIIDFDWCGEFLYPFYEHFDDPDVRNRSGALLAFWGLLLEWNDGSGFPFYDGEYIGTGHHFDHYLSTFLKHASEIQVQFPNLYYVIVEMLMKLDEEESFESIFPHIPAQLFEAMRNDLSIEDRIKPREVYAGAYKEASMEF